MESNEKNSDVNKRISQNNNVGINSLCNCLGEICKYIGESPVNFIIKNSYYFNKKLQTRIKFFYLIKMNESIKKTEETFKDFITEIKFEEILEKIKSYLKNENTVLKILKEISHKNVNFRKDFLQKLIIPLEDRLHLTRLNEKEIYNHYANNLNMRNVDLLIDNFLRIIFIPDKFPKLIIKLLAISHNFRIFLTECIKFIKEIKCKMLENKFENDYINQDDMNSYFVFVNKFHYNKLKNPLKFDRINEFNKVGEIC